MNLKKIAFFIILVMILILGGFVLFNKEEVEAPEVESYESFENYKNDFRGFEIDYPSNWEKKEMGESESEFSIGFIGENGNVLVTAIQPTENDFDELMQSGIAKISKDLDLKESKKVSLAGYPGYLLDYSGSDYDTESRYLHYFINGDDVWYQLLYTAEIDFYEENLEIVQKMFNSFVIK